MITEDFHIPTKVYHGRFCTNHLLNFFYEHGFNKTAIIIDPIVEKTQFGKNILNQLKNNTKIIFSNFTTNPSTKDISNFFDSNNNTNFDSILAVGGGSSIDLAKAINFVKTERIDFFNSFSNFKKKSYLPLVAVPTTCGTGAESSPYAVISDIKNEIKRGIYNINFLPNYVFLDPIALDSLETKMVYATIIDSLAHIIESHISKDSNELSKLYTMGLLLNYKNEIDKLISNKGKQLDNFLYLSFKSRMLFPKIGLTIAHACSHPLGIKYKLHHGNAVAIMIIKSLEFNRCGNEDCFKEIERRMGLNNIPITSLFQLLIDKGNIFKNVNINIDSKDLEILVNMTLKSSNINSNPRTVCKSNIEKLFIESMYEI